MSGILDGSHLPGVSQTEISTAEETHSTPGIVPLWHTWETEWLVLGTCIRHMAHLGQWAHQAPSCMSGLDLGRAQNTQHIWICALAEHPDNLSGLDLGSA